MSNSAATVASVILDAKIRRRSDYRVNGQGRHFGHGGRRLVENPIGNGCRACGQIILAHSARARIWQIARYDAAFLAYRVATPRPFLELAKPVRHQMARLVQVRVILLRLPPTPLRRYYRRHSSRTRRRQHLISVIPYISASRCSAAMPPTSAAAAVPAVTRIRTGIPCASTAGCSAGVL